MEVFFEGFPIDEIALADRLRKNPLLYDYMDVSKNRGGNTPQNGLLKISWKTLFFNGMIWGFGGFSHYFWFNTHSILRYFALF